MCLTVYSAVIADALKMDYNKPNIYFESCCMDGDPGQRENESNEAKITFNSQFRQAIILKRRAWRGQYDQLCAAYEKNESATDSATDRNTIIRLYMALLITKHLVERGEVRYEQQKEDLQSRIKGEFDEEVFVQVYSRVEQLNKTGM